jgi:hypothetical protein
LPHDSRSVFSAQGKDARFTIDHASGWPPE